MRNCRNFNQVDGVHRLLMDALGEHGIDLLKMELQMRFKGKPDNSLRYSSIKNTEIKMMRRLAEEGFSYRQISQFVGRPFATVSDYCTAVARQKPGKSCKTWHKIEVLKKKYPWWTNQRIAEEIGVHAATVAKHLKGCKN